MNASRQLYADLSIATTKHTKSTTACDISERQIIVKLKSRVKRNNKMAGLVSSVSSVSSD
jgi:hypothetical protein